METKYDVFISYSRKDTEVANKICAALQKNGITFFIDRQGIGGGMEFPTELAQAILDSQLFLFLASRNSYLSKFTINEIYFAFNKKERNKLLPYVIDDSTLPVGLEFAFASVNWRTIQEHPIDTILVNDLLRLLGRNTGSGQIIVNSQDDGPASPEEQFQLGEDYHYGYNGKIKDYAEAAKWYRKAAEQGDADAQWALGLCMNMDMACPKVMRKL